jgi:hypothetical protein
MVALIVAALVVGGCAGESDLASRSKSAGGMVGLKLTSPAFEYNKMIPKKYTADGEDVSPPLTWGRGPAQTKDYVLIVEDPDVSGKQPYVHWIVYNIPADQTSLPDGASGVNGMRGQSGLKEGKNSKGLIGYVGPEPSPGKAHRYFFQLFAIDAPLNLQPGADKKAVMEAMQGHALLQGELIGKYQR